jgi:hypothetical protein
LFDRSKQRTKEGLWQRIEKTMKLEDERFVHCGFREKCKIISGIFQVSPSIGPRGVVEINNSFDRIWTIIGQQAIIN